MLRKLRPTKPRATEGTFAIVASRYNRRYVDGLVAAATRELKRAGAGAVQVVRVPGAFEIPAVAATLAHEAPPDLAAILCFGVIFQGETSHAQHIGLGVTHALAQLQLQYRLPVIHGVFVFNTEEQARVRCLSRQHNRGTEAAQTALSMAGVMKQLRKKSLSPAGAFGNVGARS
jgi:6,7-dimethyl-8-ribityllumazine synthase